MGWVVNATPRRFSPGNDPVHMVQEAGWVTEPVWTGAENLAPTGIRSPDRPACSESLYRLSYPAGITKPSITFFERESERVSHRCSSVHLKISNTWRCVVGRIVPDVSVNRSAFICLTLKMKALRSSETSGSIQRHSVTSHKTWIVSNTAVRS
jgi:hypothetical protein